MEPRDVVVVGGSAGSLEPLRRLTAALQPSMPQAALAAARTAVVLSGARLGHSVSGMLGESGLVTWPHTRPREGTEVNMEHGSDVQFLSPGETGLTRLACPECGGALAEVVLPRITYYRCHVGHQFGPQSLAAARAETAEAKLWAAVAALEETAALARHLAAHAEASEDAADHPDSTAQWATDLADTVRAEMRKIPDADAGE